ncbi:MAG: MBL fold metallo-hydrolase [Clostridiales bacterium]|nr:MBL fold metallo-hydrolase [Clostridiales bacterium]
MAEVISINENTWRIEDGMVRFFLLEGSKKALLIDSGMTTSNALDIVKELTDKPIELLNTHADRDHTAGNGAFVETYMHPDEAENYSFKDGTAKIVPINDGDVIDLGNRPLQIIHIPGHTPGSIAILDVIGRILFSGDSVQNGTIFMFGQFRNINDYVESMRKLLNYCDRFDTVYPCHGSVPVTGDLIPKLIEGAESIIAGKAEGTDIELFGNQVTQYDFGYAGFFCEGK